MPPRAERRVPVAIVLIAAGAWLVDLLRGTGTGACP
jgi:hypothetical protein